MDRGPSQRQPKGSVQPGSARNRLHRENTEDTSVHQNTPSFLHARHHPTMDAAQKAGPALLAASALRHLPTNCPSLRIGPISRQDLLDRIELSSAKL